MASWPQTSRRTSSPPLEGGVSRQGIRSGDWCKDSRMLVDKLGAVVDFVMNHNVQVLLGGMFGDILVGECDIHLRLAL